MLYGEAALISESFYWKDPLLKTAAYLGRVRLSESTQGKTFARIEKELFIGFYAVRKLLDTFTVTDATRAMTFDVTVHKAVRQVDYMNYHRLDEVFDLARSTIEKRDLRFLCNQFVHSYIFSVVEDQGRLAGFFFASDTARGKYCYFINSNQVRDLFTRVGRDYPSRLELRRNEKTGQFEGSAS